MRYLEMHRRPSFPMPFPVSRNISVRTACFSSSRHRALAPFALILFSEKSTVLALKRVRPLLRALLNGRSAVRRLSIHWHHSVTSASPNPTSAIESVMRCGCPGFAGSIVQRVAQSGCSSLMEASLWAGGAAIAPGVSGASSAGFRFIGGGPAGALGASCAWGLGAGACFGVGAVGASAGTPTRTRFGGGSSAFSSASSSGSVASMAMAAFHFSSKLFTQSSVSSTESSRAGRWAWGLTLAGILALGAALTLAAASAAVCGAVGGAV
mmetsp:Transcript_111314/g.315115  ORF Transcript_111314/g.315115 Transcript_111314/m.315115 type:complete len:267 (+) Transcript_111314:1341-2141(+)